MKTVIVHFPRGNLILGYRTRFQREFQFTRLFLKSLVLRFRMRAMRACHAHTHRSTREWDRFEMPLRRRAVSIVSVIDRVDRDRTNGNDGAAVQLWCSSARITVDSVIGTTMRFKNPLPQHGSYE